MVSIVASNPKAVMELLDQIPDPEIPVVSIREMGILRDVQINEKHARLLLPLPIQRALLWGQLQMISKPCLRVTALLK